MEEMLLLMEKMKGNYSEKELEKVWKSYELANELHAGQVRQSGEPYIIHPMSVAEILVDGGLDCDTICAGLLHDTIEDSDITKEELALRFGWDVAMLVDGVTKLKGMNFSSKLEKNDANIRKIMMAMTRDIRVIIIKLADRLHNMRTLQFKSEFKQKENALETMELFVPLAYYVGSYRIMSELEDLSLRYLKPDIYFELVRKLEQIKSDNRGGLDEVESNIESLLTRAGISFEMKERTKNIYGIYNRLVQGGDLYDMHDLFSLKIMVDDIRDCYYAMGLIHSKYAPWNEKFKDYIGKPKFNRYQSLHTTVFGPNAQLIQAQIRTFKMDKVASFGMPAYWNKNAEVRIAMQEEYKKKLPLFKSLIELDREFGNNREFVQEVKTDLFGDKVYVYTIGGEIIELLKGATPVDFAYNISSELGNSLVTAYVNDKNVELDYKLKNGDRIRVVTGALSEEYRTDLENKAYTSYAKLKIKEFNNPRKIS